MISRTSLCSWFLASAALMTACGGGGGGGGENNPIAQQPAPLTPAPVTPTPAANYTISGITTTPNGGVLAGVQLALSGSSTSSTISNANGAYTFSGLTNGTYSLTPSAAGMTFSPATRSVTIQGQSASGLSFAQTFASTQSIIDYMAIVHSQTRTSFATNEQTLNRTMAAQGSSLSGSHYTQSMNGYLTLVQGFTSTSLTFIKTKAQTLAIDTPTVATLMANYATQDAAYADTYYRGAPWGLSGSSLTSVITTLQNQINSTYAAAILQIP